MDEEKYHKTVEKNIGYKYNRLECNEEYIKESVVSFGERFRENLKAPSPIHSYQSTTGHISTLDNFSIVSREGQSLARSIKKSISIRIKKTHPYRKIVKYKLSHTWDGVLFNTIKLRMKNKKELLGQEVQRTSFNYNF